MKKQKAILTPGAENSALNLSAFFGQTTMRKANELYQPLNEPVIDGNKMNLQQRNLIYWGKHLQVNRVKQWGAKYSLFGYVWYHIVNELRETCVPMERIKEFKESILQTIDIKRHISTLNLATDYVKDLKISKAEKDTLLKYLASEARLNNLQSEFTMLHLLIADSIANKKPLGVAFFADGSYIVIDKSKEHLYYTTEEKNRLANETHIVISISSILRKFFNSELAGSVLPKINLLSEAENKLFELVYSGTYESITVHYKNKNTNWVEFRKSDKPHAYLADILYAGEISEIIVTKRKGQMIKIENSNKVTL